MFKFDHAVILAAGRGMRMMPLTKTIPKAMVPFNGSTIIEEGIKKIKKNIDNVYITVGYKGQILAEHVIGIGVDAVFNTTGRGNSWWLYNTLLKNLNIPILVLTCDNVVELDYKKILEDYYKLNEPACLVIPVKPISGLDGDYIYHSNNIVNNLDRLKPSESYCSGIQVLNPYKVNKYTSEVEDFSKVWSQLIEINQLYVSNVFPKKWFTVDTLEQLNKLKNI